MGPKQGRETRREQNEPRGQRPAASCRPAWSCRSVRPGRRPRAGRGRGRRDPGHRPCRARTGRRPSFTPQMAPPGPAYEGGLGGGGRRPVGRTLRRLREDHLGERRPQHAHQGSLLRCRRWSARPSPRRAGIYEVEGVTCEVHPAARYERLAPPHLACRQRSPAIVGSMTARSTESVSEATGDRHCW